MNASGPGSTVCPPFTPPPPTNIISFPFLINTVNPRRHKKFIQERRSNVHVQRLGTGVDAT